MKDWPAVHAEVPTADALGASMNAAPARGRVAAETAAVCVMRRDMRRPKRAQEPPG